MLFDERHKIIDEKFCLIQIFIFKFAAENFTIFLHRALTDFGFL